MNERAPPSVVQVQMEALLQRVARATEERCSQLRAAAESQAHETVRSARAQALANVRKAIAEERSRIEQGRRQAEARVQLEVRQRAQREIRTLLERMWAELPEALRRRWQKPEARRRWIEAAIAEAAVLLGGRPWRIEHGSGWSEAARAESAAFAKARGSGAIEWACDPQLDAGLRICCGSACLAATAQGLLAERDYIEAAFLADYLGTDPSAGSRAASATAHGAADGRDTDSAPERS